MALTALAGSDVGDKLPAALNTLAFEIGALELDANLSKPALELFSVSLDTVQPWTIVPEYLILESVSLGLVLDWRSGALSVSGFVIAHIEVADALYLIASAERSADGSWVLTGALEKPLKVADLVKRFFPQTTVPAQVAGLQITTLSFTTDTGSGTYTFEGALSWPFTLGDVAFEVDAAATVSRKRVPGAGFATDALGTTYVIDAVDSYAYSGKLSGSLKSHFGSDQLSLGVTYQFAAGDAPVYVFVLGFNRLALSCTLTKNKAGNSILTASLTGVSFGDVITFLVDLVDPSLHFSLSSPWDVLNQITFDDFSLVADITQRTIGLTYKVGKDLGLVDIDTIALTYLHKGGQGTVDIAITGRFLDQTYTTDKPLTWDLLNSSPPATPGAGSKMLDLKYLGVGQHLVLADPKATTMPLVLADLKQTVLAAADSKVQPWDLLKFDASSGWLVGAQFVVMDTVSLGLIFNDPVLYGVQIALAGEKAGIFAGLDFQILYRKVTDSIGVYHIELKLPDVMRHLEFGEVSITLPIVILDIYTNGDFAIDFGFPFDNDWTVCFGIEVFPFVGAGGFYFAKLSAATATGLPQITNGTFNPVIEFGLALAIGVGKDFSAGPLSAGLSVTVQGVLQGTVAPFNPTGPGPNGDRYYWVKGSIAIVGKLYGIIDFKIISVQISIVAFASATLIIESYQPILIELSVGVSVTASIKILFIRIHFTFTMQLDASFTIGSPSTPPWTLAPGAGGGQGARSVLERRRPYSSLAALSARPIRRPRSLAATGTELSWAPVAVLANAPVPIGVRMVPVLTVAGGPALSVEAVLVPFVATTASPEPATATELLQTVVPEGVDPADVGFNRLVEAMLRWGVQSLLGRADGPVTSVDLQTIYADLGTAAAADQAFGFANLSAFLAANLVLTVTGPGDGSAPEMSGAAMPIMPPLQMTAGNALPVEFWAINQVGPAYLAQIAEIIAGLTVPYGDQTATDPTERNAGLVPPRGVDGADRAPMESGSTESVPTVVFDDYWLLLAKASVQAAIDGLRTLTHLTASTDSLATLAATYCPTVSYAVRAGDTVALVAAAFGIDAVELIDANPTVHFDRPLSAGTSLIVPPPMTTLPYVLLPADIAAGNVLATLATRFAATAAAVQAANPKVDFATAPAGTTVTVPVPAGVVGIADANLTVPLAAGVSLTLGGVVYRTQASDTLESIAVTRFGQTDATGLAQANAGDTALLLTGATCTIAAAGGPQPGTTFPYMVAVGDTAALIAAVVQVRNAGLAELPYASWFANAISATNPTADYTVPGSTISVPTVQVSDHGLQPTGTTTYSTKAGDSLALVAGYQAALQTAPDLLAALIQQIETLNPTIAAGSTIQIPAQSHAIVDGETLATLADRFDLGVADLATVNADAPMLAPSVAVLLPPSVVHQTSASDTLVSLAGAYGFGLDDLIGRLAPVIGLLGPKLTVPNARQADLDELVTSLESSGATNHAAGMTSRFLLHGLDLPDPAGGKGSVPFAVATGQQVTVATPPVQPPTGDLAIQLTVPTPVPWLAPAVEYVTVDGDTLASIIKTFSLSDATRLEQLNPGIDWPDLTEGITLAVPQSTIDVGLSVDQQTKQWPATTFDPELTSGPDRLPLLQTAPVHYGLSNPTPWQAALAPTVASAAAAADAAPVNGQPTLWPLPPDLVAKVAVAGTAHPYALFTGVPTATGVTPTPVGTYAWATQLPLGVRRVAAGTEYLANTYQLSGVPQAGRDQLLDLWTALAASGETASIFLLYPAPAGSGSGLRSDGLDPSLTAVLRTNLSTDTHSGVGAADSLEAAVVPAGESYATLAAPQAFLQQLWECSVTSSGGYYLTYAATGGAGLPDAVFAAGDEVTLQLIVMLASQTTGPQPDRTLRTYSTSAVVLDTIDPGRVSVYAEAADDSDLTTTATVPQGSVGFEVSRRNASLEPDSPDQRTRSLAGLLGWALEDGGGFSPVTGLPVGPTEADQPAERRAAFAAVGANSDPASWHFSQVVPVARFAAPPAPALAVGLPPAAANPYAGLGGTATFALEFGDVFGNGVQGATALPDVPVPIGYTDDVQGLSGWPGATADYGFSGPAGAAVLAVEVSLGCARYLPNASQTYQAAARAAAAAYVRYGAISCQLHQPDLSATVGTTMDAVGVPTGSGSAVLQPLRAFADSSYLFLGVAQSLQPVQFTVPPAGATPGGVAGTYGVPLGAIGSANATADATDVFDGPVTVALEHVVAAGDTFASIASATGVSMLQILDFPQNVDLPLAAGAVLTTGVRSVRAVADDTLAAMAQLVDTDVDTIAIANAGTPDLLATGVTVSVGGVSLDVDLGDSFDSLVQRFAAEGVTTTVTAIAEANAAVTGLPAAAAVFAVAPVAARASEPAGTRSYVVVAGDTLGSIAAAQQCTVAVLAAANAQLEGLLVAGPTISVRGVSQQVQAGDTFASLAARWVALDLPVGAADVAAAAQRISGLLAPRATLRIVDYVVASRQTVTDVLAAVPTLDGAQLVSFAGAAAGVFPAGTALFFGTTSYRPIPGETVEATAAACGSTVESLLMANTATPLVVGAELTIPGAVRIDPELTDQHAGYTNPAVTSLGSVAVAVGLTVTELATANATMPDLFVPGVELPTTPPTPTRTASTFSSLAAAAGLTVAELATTISGTAGLVARAALFVIPLPVAGERAFADLASALDVTLDALATANAALAGLVRPQAVFTAGSKATVTATALDTLASIAYRFAAQGVTIDSVGLVRANATVPGLLVTTSLVVVPPATGTITLPMTTPFVPAPIFPLAVTVTLSRDADLIDAEFAGVASVRSAATEITPAAEDSAGGVPSLIPLATAFGAAFADRRLALANGPTPGTGQRQVWVIDFGADGFAGIVADGAAARYFALAPMSTEPVSASGVPIADYDPATGSLGTTTSKAFSSIDVDAWLSTLLTAVDAFLTPQSATAAFSLGAHQSLETVVTAKQAIAAALRPKVAEILVGPPGTQSDGDQSDGDDPALIAAQEALYQSMLVSLATAYSVDAVIDVPVAVSSPYGQPCPVGPTDTFDTLAAAYQVTPAGVAVGLARATGLLNVGAIVTYSGTPHQIGNDDTLETLAEVYSVPVGDLPAELTVQGGGSLFATSTLGEVSMRRTPGAADSFGTVATYLGVDAGTCGLANSTLPGLVLAGTVLTVGGRSHSVLPGETLVDIATALGSQPAAVAADRSVVSRAGILDPTITWHAISTDPIPPRTSGQASLQRYILTPGATFADVVAHYGVSPEYLAEFLADMSGLIATGIALAVGAAEPVTVVAGDTPASLAAHFATSVVDLLSAPVLDPGVALFTSGFVMPLTAMSHLPTATDSFTSLATGFQTTLPELALANQDLPGILVEGSVVTTDSASHTVTATDTLITIAAALELTPSLLVIQPTVAPIVGWLGSTSPVRALQPAPASSFSTAKTALANGTSHASFLFSTAADASYRSLTFGLDYPLDEIEFGIADVPAAEGYQSSQWLRPVIPITSGAFDGAISTDLGQLTVPLPLRACPTAPTVTAQVAQPAVASPKTIAEAKAWLFDTTFRQQSAAQDDVYLEVSFGAPGVAAVSASDDVFASLAQFVSVWPLLQPDLTRLQELPLGSGDALAAQVAQTFAGLVSAVAVAMSAGSALDLVSDESSTLTLRMDTTYDYATAPITLAELTLVAEPDSTALRSPAASIEAAAIPWPDIYLPADGTTPARLLVADPPVGPSRSYRFPSGIAAFIPLSLEIVLPGVEGQTGASGLDAAAVQQAGASVMVTRNEGLVENAATAGDFVYRTPWTSAQSPAIPALVCAEVIDIGPARDLTATLTTMLDDLLTPSGGVAQAATITLGCRYAQPLAAAADPPLVSYLPVLYLPQTVVGGDSPVTVAALAGQLSDQIAVWAATSSPRLQPGDAYVFDVALFSAGNTALSRPLLTLSGLTAAVG